MFNEYPGKAKVQIPVMVTTMTIIGEKRPADTADSPTMIAPRKESAEPIGAGIRVPASRNKSNAISISSISKNDGKGTSSLCPIILKKSGSGNNSE